MEVKSNLNDWLIFAFAIVLGVMVTSFGAWKLYVSETEAIVTEFRHDINEQAESLYREMTLNLESLYSLAVLFNDGADPGYQQFNSEARNILSRHKNIQALEWIPRVTHEQRAIYESKFRKEFPGFTFTERDEKGNMTIAGKRDVYFPVFYIEPLIGNQSAFGFDLASNETRRDTIMKSMEAAIPYLTPRITLVQESEEQFGVLAFLPVYTANSETVFMRRENLRGFVLGVFRTGDIFNSSILFEKKYDIEMTLIDDTLSIVREVLYVSRINPESYINRNIYYKKKLPAIGERVWSLAASPSSGYVESRRSIAPVVVFSFGLMFTGFVTLYIYIVLKHSAIVEGLSRTDSLTGIANRRNLNEFLDREWRHAIRYNLPISCILLDVDYFKLYNDTYGHLKGDECLRLVAKILKNVAQRSTDLIARYGGEEFIIILPNTEDAEKIAKKCCQAVEALHIPHRTSEAKGVITISVGVCTVTPKIGMDLSELIILADKALYNAKEGGRNRVVSWREDENCAA